MPSVEPSANGDHPSDQQQALEARQQQQQQDVHQPAQNGDHSTNGTCPAAELDPDRHLIPADRIQHAEDAEAPVDLPTVREFTQNDKINKFLLNSFLQRLNDTDLSQFARGNDGNGDPEQDFEA